jgi:hypothetical protein
VNRNGIKAENLIWIFGTGRSGSTWLASIMGEPSGYRPWREPLVGQLFGEFYTKTSTNPGRRDFIMSDSTREAWLEGIRSLVLNVAEARFPRAADDYLVVQEPNGSLGAPLLMEALPESRMIFLVRDPRDVVASALDRHRKGGQAYERLRKDPRRGDADRVERDPEAATRGQARRYLRNMSSTKQAYEAHRGSKVLIRYEKLRYETFGMLKHAYSTLGVPVDEGELARAVEKNSWESIPSEDKGPRKNRRKATPGGWQEDLTREQVKVVEEITAPLLREFYPA